MQLIDKFSQEEKILYKKIMKEINRDPDFYLSATPVKKTRALIKNCNVNPEDLNRIMKKIVSFQDD